METKLEAFIAAYNAAPEELKLLIDSEKIGELSEKAVTQYAKDPSSIRNVAILVANLVLGVVSQEEFEKELTGFRFSETEIVDVLTQIESLVPSLAFTKTKTPINNEQQRTADIPISFAPQSVHSTQEVKMDTPTTADEQEVKAVRTMEQDMDNVHGYGAYRKMFPEEDAAANKETQKPEQPAKKQDTNTYVPATSQDELLQKRQTLTDIPAYGEKRGDT